MEELEKWKKWLEQYPGIAGQLAVDHTGQGFGWGLFPMGTQVLHRQADVVGNRYVRCRSTCQLRQVTTLGQGAQWHMAFARWVQEQSEQGNVPGLGDIPTTETVSSPKGHLQKKDPGGTATYVTDLVCEYTRVYKTEDDR